ncbi:hypothetical protein JR316_0010190 [Psilocybe cubensis]|uniref:Uncharacterized protein n=2 Tax=Psilocybe cubensis TaxID=181762 RepID=A0ACB8GRF9_PSICU|nr:hypothetical protein JR316_0010190 [Psilocybe cubensis]KAH9477957.1 hypothetical protein JR316_0010190 [Psilocybe cubensis]
MLPFQLKIAWCVLSLTGTCAVCCTIFLWAFGRVAGSKWGPMLYCVGNIMLQGMFSLGMIFRMDPFAMPRSFCMAQSILITFSTDLLTGVAIAFSMATYAAVLKPKTWSDGRRALQWRNSYMLPLVAFPAIATTVHIILVVKLDALQPSDGMHCDATSPQWTRLFGFAGVPLLMTIPAIYLSTTSILQIRKTNQHLQRAARPDSLVDELKRSMSRNNSGRRGIGAGAGNARKGGKRGVSRDADSAGKKAKGKTSVKTQVEGGREAIVPAISSPTFTAKKFHLPFGRRSRSRSATPTSRVTPQLSTTAPREGGDKYAEDDNDEEEEENDYKFNEDEDDDASSNISVTFPTFVNPHAAPIPPPAPVPMQAQTQTQLGVTDANRRNSIQQHRMTDPSDQEIKELRNSWHKRQAEADSGVAVAVVQSLDSGSGGDWTVEDEGETKGMGMMETDYYAFTEAERYASKGMGMECLSISGSSNFFVPGMRGRRQKKRHPSLAPAIRWLISFQILFIFVQLLATLSVIVDLALRRAEPTPFGTHYVALLLAAWGPVFIFGRCSVYISQFLTR